MTFNEMIKKNIDYNRKNYIEYYVSSIFVVIIFFSYASLLFNNYLNESFGLDYKVLVVPCMIITYIFSIIVLDYISSLFIRKRHKEFGIYMSMGMTQKDICKMIKIENIHIFSYSLLIGLLGGTFFSFILLKLVLFVQSNKVNIPFRLDIRSYVLTVVVFIISFIILLFINLRRIKKMEVIDLIKSHKNLQKDGKYKSLVFVIGIILLAGTLINTLYFFSTGRLSGMSDIQLKKQRLKIYINIIMYMAGLYFFISQLGGAITNKKGKYKNLLFNKNMKLKLENSKNIVYISCVLSSLVVFFIGSMYSIYLNNEKNYKNKLYDIQYLSIGNMNNFLKEEFNDILKENNSSIIEDKKLNFLVTPVNDDNLERNYMIVPQEEYNDIFNERLNIPNGEGIWIEHDSGSQEIQKVHMIDIDYKGIYLKVNKKKNNYLTDIGLFPCLIVVSNLDYENLAKSIQGDVNRKGYLRFMNFMSKENLFKTVEKIREKSLAKNTEKEKSVERFYIHVSFDIITSDITKYKGTMNSLEFFGAFSGIIFMLSLGFVQYLKLYEEIDYEKIRYNKLYKIGMGKKEVNSNIFKEFAVLFTIPLSLGAFMGYIFIKMYGVHVSSIGLYMYKALIIVFLYAAIQLVFFILSYKKYRDKVIS